MGDVDLFTGERLPPARVSRETQIEVKAREAVAGTSYALPVSRFFDYTKARGLGADKDSVGAWLDSLSGEGYSPATQAVYLSAVKKAIRAAAAELLSGREAALVSESLRKVKAPKPATKAVPRSFLLTRAEQRKAAEAMTPRDAALFGFLMATGARISEALGARLDSCKADGAIVTVPLLGKGKKARNVRIPAALFDEIRGAYPGETWLFETDEGKPVHRSYAYRRISEAVERATGKHFSPHCARHTFATRTLEKTGKVKAVSEYLGHSSASTTLDMYCHESLTDDDLGAI